MKTSNLMSLITMNVYWLGLSFMWNSIHPIVLPAILLHLVPETQKNTYLGLLTFFGLVIAMFVQPISGAVSDHWKSRLGRRRPLGIIGTLGDFLFLSLLAWSGNLLIVIVGYVGLQFASNIAHGPMQGVIPDLVEKDKLGLASGLKNLLDMAGLIVASLAAGALLSPDDRYPVTIMLVVMVVLFLCSLITFFLIKEQPSQKTTESSSISLRKIFSLDIKANKSYIWLIISRFLFLLGVYGVQTFAQYYIRDVMQAANPVKATGDLMASLALSLVACSLLGGWLTDRIGARKVIYTASGIAAVGTFLLILADNLLLLTLFAGFLGAGIGLYLSSNWALASRLAPQAEAGKFLGLTNLATAGASAVSKLWGILIDIINNAFPGYYYGYSALFLFGGIFAVASMLFLRNVEEAR